MLLKLRLGSGRLVSQKNLIGPFEKMSFLSNDQISKQRNTVSSFNSANALSFDHDYSYKMVAHRYSD